MYKDGYGPSSKKSHDKTPQEVLKELQAGYYNGTPIAEIQQGAREQLASMWAAKLLLAGGANFYYAPMVDVLKEIVAILNGDEVRIRDRLARDMLTWATELSRFLASAQ